MNPGRVTVTATTPDGPEVLRAFTFGTVVDPSANNPPDPFITVATMESLARFRWCNESTRPDGRAVRADGIRLNAALADPHCPRGGDR